MGTSPDLSSDDDSEDEVLDPVSSDVCRSIRDSTMPNLPLTQKKKCVSYYGIPRDKESLLEEVELLVEAFQDQKFHLVAHKLHHNAVQAESSRLESQIEFLETSGLEAPRSGTLTKLKSRRKGCRSRLMELSMTCATNAAEVRKLRMDSQSMKTQEAIVQRDIFAQEVSRLQRSIFHLKNLHKKVCDDNKEAIHLKEEITRLTAKVQELETSVSLKRKSFEDMATETSTWTAKGVAAKYACARDNDRFISLQGDSKSLMDLLFNEKVAKAELTTSVNTLAHQVRLAERDTREKERDAAVSE